MGNTTPKQPVPASVFIQEIRDAYAKNGNANEMVVDSPNVRRYIREKIRFDGNGEAYLPSFDIIRLAAREFPSYKLNINNSQLIFSFS